VAKSTSASELARARLAYTEDRHRRRSEAYEKFMFQAHRFHLNARRLLGPLSSEEQDKWSLEFEQQYVAVRMYGTDAVAAAAKRLHDVIGQLPQAYDEAADERFVAVYRETMAVIREDTAPD
jgi:hypothetical protein